MAAPATYEVHSWETRRFAVPIVADADPTGDTVEFGVVASTASDHDPASWTAGSWNGTYSNGRAEAYSPTFGTSESTVSPAVTLTEGTEYRLMCRVRSATDAPGALVAWLKIV